MRKLIGKISVLLVVIFATMLLMSCGQNVSSRGEVFFEVSKRADFKEIVSIKSVYGEFGYFGGRDKVCVMNSNGSLGADYYVVHTAVYKDSNGNTQVVTYDDSRPPKEIISEVKR
jgi:hypothetical protein